MVDQNPIGRSSRSNPVTYVKAFTDIRDFSLRSLWQTTQYKSGFFSLTFPAGGAKRAKAKESCILA